MSRPLIVVCRIGHMYEPSEIKGGRYMCVCVGTMGRPNCGEPVAELDIEDEHLQVLAAILRLGGSKPAREYLEEIGVWDNDHGLPLHVLKENRW